MASPLSDSVPLLTAVNNHNGTLTDEFISGLVQGSSWALDGSRTLTYSLDLNFDGPTAAWTPAWTNAIAKAFAAWEAVADINFALAGTPGAQAQNESTADIAIALAPGEGQGAIFALGLFPDPEFADTLLAALGYSRDGGEFPYPRPEGDIIFDNEAFAFYQLGLQGRGFQTILHEIGHALGLKHPDDDGANGRPVFSELDIAEYNDSAYTVMEADPFGDFSAALGLLDILAIQHIYGANMSYRTGNDVYILHDYRKYSTIWDAGGTDTLDASATSLGFLLDLRAGNFSASWSETGKIAIAYGVSIENAIGGWGYDSIIGNEADNHLSGGAGEDRLNGGGGTDTLVGGPGGDTYIVNSASDVVIEVTSDGGGDTLCSPFSVALAASLENLVLLGSRNLKGFGNNGTNHLTGNTGDNVLNGRGGEDVLNGRGGKDTLNGGPGDDLYLIAHPDQLVVEAANGGVDRVESSVTFALPDDVETLVLNGRGDINGSGNELSNQIGGNEGNNLLAGGPGNDTLSGLGGRDTITGGPGADVLWEPRFGSGGAGNDTLYGAATSTLHGGDGDDWLIAGIGLYGGDGDDLYLVNPQSIVVEVIGEGNDTIQAGASYALPENVENLTFGGISITEVLDGRGNDLANRMVNGTLDDSVLRGYGGADTLQGGSGADTLYGSTGNDSLAGGYGLADLLSGGPGNDVLIGGGLLDGGVGADILEGGSWSDTLGGGGGNDSLAGSFSHDLLNGGTGNDRLKGGPGADDFLFDTALDASTNVDRIADFGLGDDLIKLDQSVFTQLAAGGLADGVLLSGNGITTPGDADNRIIYDNATGSLYYDPDGTGASSPIKFATLAGAPTIAATDFFVIA